MTEAEEMTAPKEPESSENAEPPATVSRRDFLARAGAAGVLIAGAAAGGMLLHNRPTTWEKEEQIDPLKDFSVARDPGAVTMAVARGASVEANLRAALAELGGLNQFVSPGDHVILKPNVAFDRAPGLGATTHPETIAALTKLCLDAGASRVVVTDNPINSPDSCFTRTGIRRAAEEAGGEIFLPHPQAFAKVAIGGDALPDWECLLEPFVKADKVIGIAPLKDHNLSSASMTMKNWYGLLGGRRNQFHQNIHEIIADFCLLIKPTLVVLDATRIMMTNGPTGGSVSDVKQGDAIICGSDMVTVDAYGYEMLMERDINKLEYVHLAHERGWGDKNWRESNFREVTTG
jgi:uncharacterized protein (DUF362 family)